MTHPRDERRRNRGFAQELSRSSVPATARDCSKANLLDSRDCLVALCRRQIVGSLHRVQAGDQPGAVGNEVVVSGLNVLNLFENGSTLLGYVLEPSLRTVTLRRRLIPLKGESDILGSQRSICRAQHIDECRQFAHLR